MLNPPKSPFIKGGKLAKLIGGFFKQFLKINLTGESMQTFISKIFKTINDIIEFEAISDFIFRNIIWIMIAGFGFWFLKPQLPEIRTLLMIAVIEAIAVGLSGTAVLVYTKINFLKSENHQVLGQIFIGVHILVGLAVLGVYIAQFG